MSSIPDKSKIKIYPHFSHLKDPSDFVFSPFSEILGLLKYKGILDSISHLPPHLGHFLSFYSKSCLEYTLKVLP